MSEPSHLTICPCCGKLADQRRLAPMPHAPGLPGCPTCRAALELAGSPTTVLDRRTQQSAIAAKAAALPAPEASAP